MKLWTVLKMDFVVGMVLESAEYNFEDRRNFGYFDNKVDFVEIVNYFDFGYFDMSMAELMKLEEELMNLFLKMIKKS